MTRKSISSNLYNEDNFFMRSWGAYDYRKFIKSHARELKPRTRRLLEIANLKPSMKILEIGCGRGELVTTCALQNIYGVGIDYATDSMKFCIKTRNTLLKEKKGAEFIQADAKMLPFKNEEFNRVFIEDVVEHLYDWEINEMLKEVKRVLIVDGYAVIHTLPNRWALDYGYTFIRTFLRSLKKEPRSEAEKILHINEQDIIHFDELLQKTQFNHRIWLENIMLEESIWRQDFNKMQDHTKHYKFLRNRLIRAIYSMLGFSPFKLLFYNDIFAVIWQKHSLRSHRKMLPNNLIERICIFVSRLFLSNRRNK